MDAKNCKISRWQKRRGVHTFFAIIMLIIKTTISSIVIGLKNFHFPLITCQVVIGQFWTVCCRTVCFLVNYKRYLENIHTYLSITHSEYHFFVEVNKTNCFHRLKISHWWTNRALWWCLYLEKIFPLYYHYPIGSFVRSFI